MYKVLCVSNVEYPVKHCVRMTWNLVYHCVAAGKPLDYAYSFFSVAVMTPVSGSVFSSFCSAFF